jgi:hypothetical protein
VRIRPIHASGAVFAEEGNMSTKAGDVVIWRNEDVARCYVAVVKENDERPEQFRIRWQPKVESEAEAFAAKWIKGTGGRILDWNGVDDPTPR